MTLSGHQDMSQHTEQAFANLQQNAALVEQSAAAAGSLRDQAELLTSAVMRFKRG